MSGIAHFSAIRFAHRKNGSTATSHGQRQAKEAPKPPCPKAEKFNCLPALPQNDNAAYRLQVLRLL